MATPSNEYEKSKMRGLYHLVLALTIFVLPGLSTALSNVTINVPRAVKRGGNATLSCTYDLEWGNLYSVKWYKGKYEFYRYMPSASPNIKVFILGNLRVDTSVSNQTHLLLLNMQPEMSGKYTCEISMDAPDFTTAMISGELGVVELPKETAIVTGIQSRYRIGDLVDGNCSIKFSKPAANLTWTINGIVVPPHHIKTYQIEKHENGSLESVMSALNFMVTTQHFIKGKMRLICEASIYDIFNVEIENVIEEDRPRIMASGQSYDINNYPYEQHPNTNGEGFEDHNESYLTYYSAADTTSGAEKHASNIAIRTLKRYIERIWLVLETVVFEARELTARFTPLTPPSLPLTPASSEAAAAAAFATVSHLSTRWTGLLGALQQQSNRKTHNENLVFNIFHAQGYRESVARNGSLAIFPIVACYVALTIILTHHFMSCQNTRMTKAAIKAAKSTKIDAQHLRTKARKRSSSSSAASGATPLSVCSNKSFYNCQESVETNKSKSRNLSLLKRQQKHPRQWNRQQNDCQFDDNIHDDCQQQQREQQQEQRQTPKRKLASHFQISKQTLSIYPAISDVITKSNEKYIRDSIIAAPDAFLSVSKDQILLMTYAAVPSLSIFFPSYTFAVSLNPAIMKTVSKQVENKRQFLQFIFQTPGSASFHRDECQHFNC